MSNWVPQLQVKLMGLRKLTSGNTEFQWNLYLEEEFHNVKNMMLNKIPLTPMDIWKETHVHCDATKEGLGWILSQIQDDSMESTDYKAPRNIIMFGSTTLKDS